MLNENDAVTVEVVPGQYIYEAHVGKSLRTLRPTHRTPEESIGGLISRMKYYDLKRHWTKRVEPHLSDPKLQAILVRDFNKFTYGRWKQEFTHASSLVTSSLAIGAWITEAASHVSGAT